MDQHNVGGLDVAVEQSLLVCIVQPAGHRTDDPDTSSRGRARRVAIHQQTSCVEAIDEVHGDPQLTVGLAAVVHAHDVRMPQSRGKVGFSDEPCSVLLV